jgi:lysophospholipase L1-like esterase
MFQKPSEGVTDPIPSAATPSSRRVQNLFLWIAVVVCAGIVADNVLFKARGGIGLGVADGLFAGLAGGFLLIALLSRRAGRKLAVPVVAVLFGLALVEGGLSVWSLRQPRRWSWYVWPPNYSCLLKPANLAGVSPQGCFRTNSLGIRGPEFRDTDTYRILCVGGSSTECLYLDDAKAWPAALQRMLGDFQPGIWVGNVGLSGTTAPQHALVLERLPEARLVDCWVVLCGINDLGQQLNGTYAQATANSFGRTFKYRRPGLAGRFRRPLQRNLYTFALLESVCQRVLVVLQGENAAVYQDVQAGWIRKHRAKRQAGVKIAVDIDPRWLQEYQAQLMRMIELAGRQDKRLIFMTQPTIWVERMDEKTEELTLGGQLPDGRYADSPTRVRGMDLYNQAMRDVAAREGIELVDLAATLPKTTEVFYDDCHFNENGAQLVGAALAEQIKTRNLQTGARK